MKFYLKLIKYYLNFLSVFTPKYGGKIAVRLFQKVRLREIKTREEPFYKNTQASILKVNNQDMLFYELGNPKGNLIFLVHGWDSNAGSLSMFAFEFAKNNYRVISLDLPAHAKSQGTHTNLFECKDALIQLIKHVNPQQKFSIIGHSFGAAVTSYALAELDYKINKIVLLSANNIMKVIFDDYQKLVGFNDKIYNQVSLWTKQNFNQSLEELILSDKIKIIKYDELLIIHDKFDKVLPFKSALEIKEAIPTTKIIAFEKIGHYRMLWNKEVLKETIKFIIQ